MNESLPLPAGLVQASSDARDHLWRRRLRSLLVPSLSDALFVSLVWLVFMTGVGWITLLGDGDTGMHIRTGDVILATRAAPVSDPHALTVTGKPWYAWEWLADVSFAGVHRLAGLKGVVWMSGTLICATLIIVFRHMLWRGAGLHVAVLMTLIVADALRFHYLARPHIFTTLLAAATLWMLDRDWSRPSRSIWLLVPIAAIWTNLHGGFLVLIVFLACFSVAALLRREKGRASRYGLLAAACSAATLVNPYGWKLHLHIWNYLRSDWLIKNIDEFQSPAFRSETMFKFEVLLFLGLAIVIGLVRERRYRDALLILFWAHAALISVRHVTLYAIVAAPPVAEWLGAAWNRWTASSAAGSIKGVVRDLVHDFEPHALRTSIWTPVFVAVLLAGTWGGQWPTDFPSATFPTDLVARNMTALNGPGHENARILSSDLWGGYLIYALYPNRHVFIDGRSDFHGPKAINEYSSLRSGADNWQEVAARHGFDFALIPRDWALANALRRSPEWTLRDQDQRAFLFEHRPASGPS